MKEKYLSVSHNVWGAKYTTTPNPITEATTETIPFNQNDDINNDNPDNDTHILGVSGEDEVEPTTEETVTETESPTTTTTTTTVVDEVPTPDPAKGSTTEVPTTTLEPFTESSQIMKKEPSIFDSMLGVMDLSHEPDPEPVLSMSNDTSASNTNANNVETSASSNTTRSCDCASGCGTDRNCQGSSCCCSKLNLNSTNYAGNFTINLNYGNACNRSNTGCN